MRNCENCYHYHMCDLQNRLEDEQDCKHYKDKSLIVELPCKVGDIVYKDEFGEIYEKEVTGYRIGEMYDEDEYDVEDIILDELYIQLVGGFVSTSAPISCFGKTVFLTREEAEKALRESEKNDNE